MARNKYDADGNFIPRTKEEVVSRTPFTFPGHKKEDGTPAVSGTIVRYKDGESDSLLNSSGRGYKYSQELATRQQFTNEGELKVDEAGNPLGLRNTQAAYRGGYLKAQKHAAKAYNAEKAKKK